MRHMLLVSILTPTLVCGCASHAVDQHYGAALAQMVRAQTYDVHAGDDTAVLGMDQVQQMHALDVLRGDVTDRSAVKPTPLINISQQSGGGGGGSGSQ